MDAHVDDKTIHSLPALGSDLIVLLRNFPFPATSWNKRDTLWNKHREIHVNLKNKIHLFLYDTSLIAEFHKKRKQWPLPAIAFHSLKCKLAVAAAAHGAGTAIALHRAGEGNCKTLKVKNTVHIYTPELDVHA